MKWYKRLNISVAIKVSLIVVIISVIFGVLLVNHQRAALFESSIGKAKIAAMSGSYLIGKELEGILERKEISEEKLFSSEYEAIPNTNPVRHLSPFTLLAEQYFPHIEDSFMSDEELMYAVAITLDGYVPVHNGKYNEPLTGNVEHDTKFNRSRRLFRDEQNLVFLAQAANNKSGTLVQSYFQKDWNRIFWDVSAPVYVNGKHWGSFRVGITMQNVDHRIWGMWKYMILFFGLMVITVIMMIYWSIRRVIDPVVKISGYMREISRGNLTNKLSLKTRDDEIGELVKSVDEMTDRLTMILREQRGIIDTIDGSVSKLTAAMNDEASAINEQTASISETSSTVEELSTIAQEIEDNSKKIVEALSKNIEIGSDSKTAMNYLKELIRDISEKNKIYVMEIVDLRERSRRIEEVIQMIDEIADQTKLIAFNATIEAVGSGETGKRFTIVAEEIRRLANNVMQSSDEIKTIIQEISASTSIILEMSKKETDAISRVVESADIADSAFDNVVDMSTESHTLVRSISQSMSQQKNATEQVLNAIKDIADGSLMINENVNSNLIQVNLFSELSKKLKEMISRFRL